MLTSRPSKDLPPPATCIATWVLSTVLGWARGTTRGGTRVQLVLGISGRVTVGYLCLRTTL